MLWNGHSIKLINNGMFEILSMNVFTNGAKYLRMD